MELVRIATYHSPLREKFGVPRQSGLAPSVKGRIVFEPAFRDANALRGLEGFSHIWLLWAFSANRPAGHSGQGRKTSWTPTVRPPRLGGNTAMGVFATRSPYRPNPIGLSSVRLESIDLSTPDGPVLHVCGADLMDGTPIYDIKPYVSYADSHPDATSGFVDATPWEPLTVVIPDKFRQQIQNTFLDVKEARLHLQSLEEILSQDPRPQYHRSNPVISTAPSVISTEAEKSPPKTYGLSYGPWNIRFTVSGTVLTVIDIQ